MDNSETYENIYRSSLKEIDSLRMQLNSEEIELEKILTTEMDNDFINTKSNLDTYDYLFAVLFGIAGAIISTNKQIADFSEQVHRNASLKKGNHKANSIESFLGDLLNHYGDAMDIPEGSSNFLNRSGENAYGLFHRLLRGHDILSIGHGDNPFVIMVKQNGLMKGIMQTFRHIIADTFSKQGLPLPGSSFFDYKKDDGKISNYLIKIVQDMAKEKGNGSLAEEYYSHMFTIRMQDVAAQGLVYAAANAYFCFRNIKDKMRQTQYKVISYTVNFLAHAIIGSFRQGGVPYINWIALGMVVKEVASLYIKSNKETKRLEKITQEIINRNNYLIKANEELERKVFATGIYLKSCTSSEEYISNYLIEENNSLDLIDFFGEE